MVKRAFALSVFISALLTAPCFAQAMQFDPSQNSPFTETQIDPSSNATTANMNPQANIITGIYYNPLNQSGAQTVNGLPPTMMDSFVYNAGGMAELIYGDEGTTDIPPYFVFDQSHRINTGISGVDAAGLTTGHGSVLPNAWGGDEFVGPEFSMAGSPMPNAPGTINFLGGQIHVPNVNIPGLPGGIQSLVGGQNGLGSSGF